MNTVATVGLFLYNFLWFILHLQNKSVRCSGWSVVDLRKYNLIEVTYNGGMFETQQF